MNFIILLTESTGTGTGTPTAPSGGAAFLTNFMPIILIIVVMYFFLLRPQTKKQREEKSFRESMKKGDKIMTIGGIFGRVESIEDNAVFIEVDKDVKLKMAKEAIRPAPDNEPGK